MDTYIMYKVQDYNNSPHPVTMSAFDSYIKTLTWAQCTDRSCRLSFELLLLVYLKGWKYRRFSYNSKDKQCNRKRDSRTTTKIGNQIKCIWS